MKSSTIATTTLVLALAWITGPGAADAFAACSAPVKSTAYDNPADDDGYIYVGNHPTQGTNDRWAQSFTLSAPVTLNKVSLYLVSSPSQSQSIVVEIHSDSAGKPGAILATRSAVFTNPDASHPVFHGLDFSADRLALAAGTRYFIVAQSAGIYGWEYDGTDPTYSGGEAFRSTSSAPSWAPQGYDLLFQVFGQTCTADTQPGGQTQNPPLAAVSGLAFSNTTFAAQGSGPPATNARKKAPRGTKVSFRLNEAASVRFKVTRRAKGRKVKRGKRTRCLKPTRKNRKNRRCTRVVTLKGSFTRAGVAGKNRFHFTGRLRGRKLKPGRYRLVATPTAGGKKGKPTSSGFRIVR